MHKTFLIALRELSENVRTKGFWIGIFIFPVILTVMMVVPTLLERTKSARRYAVIDNSGWLLDAFVRQIRIGDLSIAFQEAVEKESEGETADLPPLLAGLAPQLTQLEPAQLGVAAAAIVSAGEGNALGGLTPEIQQVVARGDEILDWLTSLSSGGARDISSRMSEASYSLIDGSGRTEEELSQMIVDDQLFAYFMIDSDPVAGTEASRYVSNNLTDDDLQNWFRRVATSEVRARRLAQEDIDPTVAGWIQAPLLLESLKIGESGAQEEVDTADTIHQWAPVVFLYLLWISVFSASQMLLTNTIEEKSNRIIEVLLSSVSPLQLMVGKIAGIAASGLILVGSWMLMFYLGTKFVPPMLGAPSTMDLSSLATDPAYILSFLVYFLLGYLLYAALLVAIGSVVNTIKEAQNLMGPITLMLMLPLVSMIPIGRDPNGTLAVILSYIPPFTPFAMMNRAAGPPSAFEYITTTILLLVSVALAMWGAAKVFRIGVLLTGKPPSFREIIRWIRAPVGAIPDRSEG